MKYFFFLFLILSSFSLPYLEDIIEDIQMDIEFVEHLEIDETEDSQIQILTENDLKSGLSKGKIDHICKFHTFHKREIQNPPPEQT